MDELPPDKDEVSRSQMRAYTASTEAVLALVIGVGIGMLVDSRFETQPWGVVVGIIVGFSAMILRIFRIRNAGEREKKQ